MGRQVGRRACVHACMWPFGHLGKRSGGRQFGRAGGQLVVRSGWLAGKCAGVSACMWAFGQAFGWAGIWAFARHWGGRPGSWAVSWSNGRYVSGYSGVRGCGSGCLAVQAGGHVQTSTAIIGLYQM